MITIQQLLIDLEIDVSELETIEENLETKKLSFLNEISLINEKLKELSIKKEQNNDIIKYIKQSGNPPAPEGYTKFPQRLITHDNSNQTENITNT